MQKNKNIQSGPEKNILLKNNNNKECSYSLASLRRESIDLDLDINVNSHEAS